MRYALLVLPSANRVYAESAVAMTCAELSVFSRTALQNRLADIESVTLGGVPYVSFEATGAELDATEIATLSNLSSAYALFSSTADSWDSPVALSPVTLDPLDVYSDDLITIQKYTGKTNEQFTKLLLNVTALSSSFGLSPDNPVRVFDPLCGRGTTLNQALMYGWNASGMDIDGKDFDAYRAFLETWLRRKRLKHQTSVAPIRRERKLIGRRLEVSLSPSKESYKAGSRQELTVVNADSTRAREFFKPRSFELIVADLPYGVAHGSRSPASDLSRRPLELLRAAVPGWAGLLRPGGAIGLSWNTLGAKREEVTSILEGAGLSVLSDGPYEEFAHRVDQAITRDLIVATPE